MKRVILLVIATMTLTAQAKKTYIPRYTTTMAIAMRGADTVTVENHSLEVSLISTDGLFTATVYHDDMTMEKLKTIRRNKAATGWAAFSATASTFAYAMSDNFADRLVNYRNAKIASILSGIYSANAEAATVLGIVLVIDNPSDAELSVNDIEHGMLWHILPHGSLTLKLSNPDVAQLRIADTNNNQPHYLTVGTGSEMKPLDVIYEDENYIVIPIYVTDEKGIKTISCYNITDRRTFDQRSVTKEEYKQFKQQRKP